MDFNTHLKEINFREYKEMLDTLNQPQGSGSGVRPVSSKEQKQKVTEQYQAQVSEFNYSDYYIDRMRVRGV
jgi:hypothetical protein